VLTKRIGTGIAVQALKKLEAPAELTAATVQSMRRLNDAARDAGVAFGATAATDVTGFGLLGHLKHLAEASGVAAHIEAARVPFFDGARALAERGVAPGGSKRNQRYVEHVTRYAAGVDEATRLLLADAQTSGGLLLAVPRDRAEALALALVERGDVGAIVGELVERAPDAPVIDVR
jgi:selenide,water dikinase